MLSIMCIGGRHLLAHLHRITGAELLIGARELATQCKKSLPRVSAPNHSLLKKVVGANTRRAVSMRSTIFVQQLLHQPEGATIARVVTRCREAEYRVCEGDDRSISCAGLFPSDQPTVSNK